MKTWPSIIALTAAMVAAPQAHAQLIIHVPQAQQRDHAARPSKGYDASASVDADEVIATPRLNRPAAVPRIQKPHVEHRRAFAPSPPPSESKRTMLAAPPLEELSPIRPLPRWRDGAASASSETSDTTQK
jgi:hypothetical protein